MGKGRTAGRGGTERNTGTTRRGVQQRELDCEASRGSRPPCPPCLPPCLLWRHVEAATAKAVLPLAVPGVAPRRGVQHTQLHASLGERVSWRGGGWRQDQGHRMCGGCMTGPQHSSRSLTHLHPCPAPAPLVPLTLFDTSSVLTWRTRSSSHRSSHSCTAGRDRAPQLGTCVETWQSMPSGTAPSCMLFCRRQCTCAATRTGEPRRQPRRRTADTPEATLPHAPASAAARWHAWSRPRGR